MATYFFETMPTAAILADLGLRAGDVLVFGDESVVTHEIVVSDHDPLRGADIERLWIDELRAPPELRVLGDDVITAERGFDWVARNQAPRAPRRR